MQIRDVIDCFFKMFLSSNAISQIKIIIEDILKKFYQTFDDF